MIITRPDEFAGLQHANQATTRLLRELQVHGQTRDSTRELDDYARAYIRKLGGEPVFETQNGFPGAINTNRNDIVVHGIPGDEVLEAGDILTIDAGMLLNGFAGDAATTFTIGPAETPAGPDRCHLGVDEHRHRGGQNRQPGGRCVLGDAIGGGSAGYNVARGFCGHGIGRRCWEDPQVPFAGKAGTGPLLSRAW